MIRYSLTCGDGHAFESWFASAGAFDGLARSGHLSCPDCGSPEVLKALMAPSVAPKRRVPRSDGQSPEAAKPDVAMIATPAPGPLGPQTAREAALLALRKQIEAQSSYVGKDFAAEARRIHLGDAPDRAIHGEARPEEARALIEDGIPVLPLPLAALRKTN